MPRSAVKRSAVLATFAACVVAVFLMREAILPGLCSWLDVGEVPDCSTHVFVLPGDETYRPVTAAAIVKSGLAGSVLIPETAVNADVTDGIHPPTAHVLVSILRHCGVPDKKILCLDAASRTTVDDAKALSAFLEQRPRDRVIVVTNAFHTRRARFIFRRVLDNQADRLRFVSAPNPGFADETWWKYRSSWNMVLSENLKLAFYVVRYSGQYGWLGSLLLVAILWRWRQRRSHRRQELGTKTISADGSAPEQGELCRPLQTSGGTEN